MSEAVAELASLFEGPILETEGLRRLADATHASFQAREKFEDVLRDYRAKVDRGQGEPLRLGLGYWVIGQYANALEALAKAPDNKHRRYFAAHCKWAQGQRESALEEFERAGAKGWDAFETDLHCAVLQAQLGNLAAAEKLHAKHRSAGADRADWYYVQGFIAERRDERAAAVAAFEKALTLDPQHTDAAFNCARLYDLFGEDDEAIALYERLALQSRAFVNAVLNLAVLYEDRGSYDEALDCLRRVLKVFPNHTRARLFFKDVDSCRRMVILEGGDKRPDARSRVLDQPISEFELSVRARNCLKKMKIHTIGDLVKLSEAELLAFKNFGETSLTEIRAMLAKRGLRLGAKADEIEAADAAPELAAPPPPRVPVPPGAEGLLAKPVSELELSVRARRCLQRLNVVLVGDLIQKSEAELLAARNFGVTSLNEINARLGELGLKLAGPRRGE